MWYSSLRCAHQSFNRRQSISYSFFFLLDESLLGGRGANRLCRKVRAWLIELCSKPGMGYGEYAGGCEAPGCGGA